MSKSPFILVPWQNDFISALLEVALSDGPLGEAVFVFPHARPARYLERLIREDARIAKPCLMPQCLTASHLFADIYNEAYGPSRPAGQLDRVGLLLECLRAEQAEKPGSISRIPTGDAKAFFPWGRRLDALFEDCLSSRRKPENFLHLDGEVLPFAAAILSRLGSLYSRYIAGMEAAAWRSPGLTAQKSLEALEGGSPPRILRQGKRIYICGFCSPSAVEEALFKRLWLEHTARVLVHADPALAHGTPHWSCAALEDWQKSWGAGLELLGSPGKTEPALHFYAAYDVHSQLAFLRSSIHRQSRETGKELEDTAVILPDTSLLLPVLHHIQADDVNISMGYPLSNTALQRFLEAIMALHENTRQGFYWRDALGFLRQPYLKMLDDGADESGRSLWRELLLKAEQRLLAGQRYVDLAQTLQKCLSELEPGENLEKITQLWESVRLVCLELWRDLPNLAALGDALEQLLALLLEKGASIWPRFPIDAECLSRLASSLIPELKNSYMAGDALPRASIFAIFRELMQAERVPFDAYPLTVLQIMGLLESRLLSFKNVFIMDATDDILPGGPQNDPLLPDSLRAELGLPSVARRQRLTAYYFFRLLQSAENVHIFWQEGIEPQGLLDAKKLKSRFAEELIWRQEQKLGRLLAPQSPVPDEAPELPPLLVDGPLHSVGSRLNPFRSENRIIQLSDNAAKKLRDFLSRPISPTRLNSYLNCPAAFYYAELAEIKEAESVNEDEDHLAVGNLFHQALKDYYAPLLGRALQAVGQNPAELCRVYLSAMENSADIAALPVDQRLMLERSGQRSLRRYLREQPDETRVLALELPFNASLQSASGKLFQLKGTLDRIDMRGQAAGQPELVVLDYKTGRIVSPAADFWADGELWDKLAQGQDACGGQEFFLALAERLGNLQLPMYLYLMAYGQPELNNPDSKTAQELKNAGPAAQAAFSALAPLGNAAWVSLKDNGEEFFMLSPELEQAEREEIIGNKIPLLLDYLLGHLAGAATFAPRPTPLCKNCAYSDICIVLS